MIFVLSDSPHSLTNSQITLWHAASPRLLKYAVIAGHDNINRSTALPKLNHLVGPCRQTFLYSISNSSKNVCNSLVRFALFENSAYTFIIKFSTSYVNSFPHHMLYGVSGSVVKNVTIAVCFNHFGVRIFLINFLVHGIVCTIIHRCVICRECRQKR